MTASETPRIQHVERSVLVEVVIAIIDRERPPGEETLLITGRIGTHPCTRFPVSLSTVSAWGLLRWLKVVLS